jgi:uncharacterized protein with beta-barrel porin domain
MTTDGTVTIAGIDQLHAEFNANAYSGRLEGGTRFVVNGAAQAHDSALTTASAEMKWRNGISLAGTFEGQFSDVTNSYPGKGVVGYSW